MLNVKALKKILDPSVMNLDLKVRIKRNKITMEVISIPA